MSTFFHRTFAEPERVKITPEDAIARMAKTPEHPFVSARRYVSVLTDAQIEGFLTPAGRKVVDKQRTDKYYWEQAITSTEPGKALFAAVYRPGFLGHEYLVDQLGHSLAEIVTNFASRPKVDMCDVFGAPNMAAVYRIASILRGEDRYRDLPRHRVWTPTDEQHAQIMEMLAQRKAYSEISASMGVSINTLREYLRTNDLMPERSRGRPSNPQRDDEIRKDWVNGLTCVELSAKYNLTNQRIYQIVRGLPPEGGEEYTKARIKDLFRSYPPVSEEVECAIHTLLAWAEEE
jgi:hypothetical protein